MRSAGSPAPVRGVWWPSSLPPVTPPIKSAKIFLRFSGCEGNRPRIIDPDYCGIIRAPIRQVFGKPFRLTGFIKGEKITEAIRSLCEAKGFSSMRKARIPLAIPAVDIKHPPVR